LPARILGVDAEVFRVPVDVRVGIEVLDDGLMAETRDQSRVGVARRACALFLGNDGVEGGGLSGHEGLLSPRSALTDGVLPNASGASDLSASSRSSSRAASGTATSSRASPWSRANTNRGTR